MEDMNKIGFREAKDRGPEFFTKYCLDRYIKELKENTRLRMELNEYQKRLESEILHEKKNPTLKVVKMNPVFR